MPFKYDFVDFFALFFLRNAEIFMKNHVSSVKSSLLL
jgi:hypothetical protein